MKDADYSELNGLFLNVSFLLLSLCSYFLGISQLVAFKLNIDLV